MGERAWLFAYTLVGTKVKSYMQRCFIIGAGEFDATYFLPEINDYLIAADGGYRFFEKMHKSPDLIIGDFDSMDKFGLCKEKAIEQKIWVEKLPKEKDDTDLLAAIKAGREKGCEEFHIFGGTGGRIDHTIANIQCLVYLSRQGCMGYLYGKGYVMLAITDGKVEFDEQEGGVLSIFSMGNKAEGVTLTGLKYPLTNALVTNEFPIGVSNEFIQEGSRIEVKKGTLLVIRYL